MPTPPTLPIDAVGAATIATSTPSASNPPPIKPAKSHRKPQPRYVLRERPTRVQKAGVKTRKQPMAMANEAAKRFFSAPYFAVAGASGDVEKFGYKSMFALVYYHFVLMFLLFVYRLDDI